MHKSYEIMWKGLRITCNDQDKSKDSILENINHTHGKCKFKFIKHLCVTLEIYLSLLLWDVFR